MMDRQRTLPLLLALLPALASAQTRPAQTEEASTAPAGTLAFEIGGDYAASEPNFQTGFVRDRIDAPVFSLVYSPADDVEIDLAWVAHIVALDDPTFAGASDFGDVTLRTKWRFFESETVDIGARYNLTLPQTEFGEGLGPNVLRMSAQFLFTRRFGDSALHLNAGLGIHDEVFVPHSQRDFLHYGAALTHRFGPSAELVAEASGYAGNGRPGADERGEARLGVRLGSGRVRYDAAVRLGYTDADGDWGITAGLTWHIKKRVATDAGDDAGGSEVSAIHEERR